MFILVFPSKYLFAFQAEEASDKAEDGSDGEAQERSDKEATAKEVEEITDEE